MKCLVTDGNLPDCDNLPVAGTEVNVIIYNLSEYLDTIDNDGVVTNIYAPGFIFSGFRNDIKKSEELIIPTSGTSCFKHLSGFIVYAKDQNTKNTIEKLARGKFVLAIENKGKQNDAFEVVGRKSGVQLSAGSILDAHANGGYYVLNLATATEDGDYETKLPATFFNTDYETSKQLLFGDNQDDDMTYIYVNSDSSTVLPFNNVKDITFIDEADVITDKSYSITNASNGFYFRYLFNGVAGAQLTFDGNFFSNNIEWEEDADNTFTLIDTRKYLLEGYFDGTNWLLKLS